MVLIVVVVVVAAVVVVVVKECRLKWPPFHTYVSIHVSTSHFGIIPPFWLKALRKRFAACACKLGPGKAVGHQFNWLTASIVLASSLV